MSGNRADFFRALVVQGAQGNLRLTARESAEPSQARRLAMGAVLGASVVVGSGCPGISYPFPDGGLTSIECTDAMPCLDGGHRDGGDGGTPGDGGQDGGNRG